MHDGNSELFDYNVPANTMRIKHEGWGKRDIGKGGSGFASTVYTFLLS